MPPAHGHLASGQRHDSAGRADIAAWDSEKLGAFIGYLPQDVDLFSGTVAENIARMGKVDPERVVRAAQIAGVHELILRLPNGYDTPIGDIGQGLSGGQRQRIGLARALYGDPRVVILDEPNSNLDEEGEARLMQCLSRLKRFGATVVIVAHRPSILAAVDEILVLDQGRIQFYGPRELVKRQMAEKQRKQRQAVLQQQGPRQPIVFQNVVNRRDADERSVG